MRSLKTREAAALLNVSPNTLRVWEQKYGFPTPVREPGRHRSYAYAEIVALRDVLDGGLSVASAVSVVRDGLGADAETLVRSLLRGDEPGADRAMEASLALRPLERSVQEVGVIVPVEAIRGLAELATSAQPDCVVIAGGASRDDDVARWAFTVRQALGHAVPVALFRRPLRSPDPSPRAVVLPGLVHEACALLIEMVTEARASASATQAHALGHAADKAAKRG